MTTQQSSRPATPERPGSERPGSKRPGSAERLAARTVRGRRLPAPSPWRRWSAPSSGRWGRSSRRSSWRWRGRSRRRALVVSLVVVLLAAVAAWVVLLSPLLAVRTVTVTGLPAPAAAAARARAAVALGQPLARVDTRAIATRVLDADLDSVTVRRSYPSTLMVRAVPRVAVLATRNSQGQVEVWDRHGVPMALAAAAPAGVPLLDEGDAPLTPASVTTLTGVLQSLPAVDRRRVSDIAVSDIGLVTFRMGSRRVTWGDASDSALKARVLDVLERQAKSSIDVSAPRTPAVR